MGIGSKIVAGLVGLVVVGFMGTWFFARGVFEDNAKEKVLQSVQGQFDSFNLAQLKFTELYPLKIELQGLSFTKGDTEFLGADKFHIILSLRDGLFKGYKLQAEIDGIQIKHSIKKEDVKKPKGPGAATSVGGGGLVLPPLEVDVKLSQGNVKIDHHDPHLGFSIEGLNASFYNQKISEASNPWQLNIGLTIATFIKGLEFRLPFEMGSEDLIGNAELVQTEQLNVDLAGLKMVFKGKSIWSNSSHNWTSDFEMAELANLPKAPGFLPNGRWQGSVKGKVNYNQQASTPPNLSFDIETSRLNGNVLYKKGELEAQGQVLAQFNVGGTYNESLSVKSLKGSMNFDNANIKFGQLIDKPKGIPLNGIFDLSFLQGILGLNSTQINFHKLQANAKGSISDNPSNNSKLELNVLPTTLDSFEKLIPIASSYPMRGSVACNVELGGQITDLSSLSLWIKNYNVNNLSAVLDFEDKEKGLLVKGPLQLTSNGQIKYQDGQLVEANASINLNADKMTLQFRDGLKKSANESFKMVANLVQQGPNVSFSNANLNLPGINTVLSGSLNLGKKPSFNVSSVIQSYDTELLASSVAALKQLDFKVAGNGKLSASGVWDPEVENFLDQDILVNGEMLAKIPELKVKYKLPDTKPKTGPRTADEIINPKPPDPILPVSKVLQKAKLKINFLADYIYINQLRIAKVSTKVDYSEGAIKINGATKDFYGGSVDIKKLDSHLLTNGPDTKFEFAVAGVQLGGVLNALAPRYQDDFVGILTSTFKGTVPYPHGKDWENRIFVLGNFNLQKADLKTFKFDKMANQKLAKLEGIGVNRRVATRGLAADVKARAFQIKEGKINWRGLNMITPERNEFRADGAFDFNLNADLRGDLFLVNPPVRGSVLEANKDSTGRLVMPVAIRGSIVNPELKFARDTIDGLLTNAMKYEADKISAKAQRQLEKKASKEAEKAKVKVKKQIESIFTTE